jgi:ABC-2 type transport system permease protein
MSRVADPPRALTQAPAPASRTRGGMLAAVRAEWIKLRTVSGPGWLLLACAVVTITVSSAVVAVEKCSPASCVADTTKVSLTGAQVGQAAVAVLGVMVIGGEYATGMVRVTLAAVPRRRVMLAAKAIVVAVVTAAAGIIAVLGSLLAGRIFLPGNGFTAAHGFMPLSLGDGPTLRAAAGSVLYLVLVALFSLGVATAVRDTAAAIAIVAGLMYVVRAVSSLVLDPTWQHRVERIAPMNAGLAIQATANLGKLPIGPWAGLGVLAAWTAAALLAGWLLLQLRDA